jgi:hypothetical protein
MIEQHGHSEVQDEHADEAAEHGQVLAPDVLAGGQPGRVQKRADVLVAIPDERHARGDGDEEAVHDRHQHDEELRIRELGGEPRPGAAHAHVPRTDARIADRELKDEETEEEEENPEQRPARHVRQVEAKHFAEAGESSRPLHAPAIISR